MRKLGLTAVLVLVMIANTFGQNHKKALKSIKKAGYTESTIVSVEEIIVDLSFEEQERLINAKYNANISMIRLGGRVSPSFYVPTKEINYVVVFMDQFDSKRTILMDRRYKIKL